MFARKMYCCLPHEIQTGSMVAADVQEGGNFELASMDRILVDVRSTRVVETVDFEMEGDGGTSPTVRENYYGGYAEARMQIEEAESGQKKYMEMFGVREMQADLRCPGSSEIPVCVSRDETERL